MKSLDLLMGIGANGAGNFDARVANGIARTSKAVLDSGEDLKSLAKSVAVAGIATVADNALDCTATKLAKNVAVGILAVKGLTTANSMWNKAMSYSGEDIEAFMNKYLGEENQEQENKGDDNNE